MPSGMEVVRLVVVSALASTILRGYISTEGTSSLQSKKCLNGGVSGAQKIQSMILKDFHGCKCRAAAAAFAEAWCLTLPFERQA